MFVVFGNMDPYMNHGKVISFFFFHFFSFAYSGSKKDVAHATPCQDFTPLCLDLDHISEFKEKQADVISLAY